MKEWARSIGGAVLTGEKVIGDKPVPVPLHPPQIPHGLVWESIWTMWREAGE